MRAVSDEFGEIPGQDSFLDVLMNMVGTIILMVVVMGLRASRHASGTAEGTAPPVSVVSKADVDGAYRAARSTQQDVQGLVQRAVDVRGETLFREKERNFLSTYVTAFEQELNERREKLSVDEQRDFDLRRKLAESQQTLDGLTREQVMLLSQPAEVEQVQSLPTPLAQTASGKEVHLRLADGHVSFVPLDDLLAELKQHAESNLWELKDQDSVVDNVGPIGGFKMRYRLQKTHYTVNKSGAVESRGTWVQLARWEIVPSAAQLGEPVDQAIQPRSDLWCSLKRFPADTCSVTIWTYPGSFDDFRKLKQALFQAGYATAARPLPSGIPIGGSPNGTKSAVQ